MEEERNYVYPILKETDKKTIRLRYPTFPEAEVTSLREETDYIRAAQDHLALLILKRQQRGMALPDEKTAVSPEPNQKLIYVDLWMPYHKTITDLKYVKKNVKIPAPISVMGTQHNLNFSAILASEVIKELNVQNPGPSKARQRRKKPEK